jgi:hypothetical protein
MEKKIVLAFVVLIVCLFIFIGIIMKANNEEVTVYEQMIGDTVIMNKDTLIVVDYSRLDATVTLSNGVKVSKSLVQ